MNLATGWIALALLGADEPMPTPSAGPLIRYEMRVLEMKGLDWRGKAHEKLAIVARQGTATIWTASKSAVPELVKAAEKVVASPRVSTAPEIRRGLRARRRGLDRRRPEARRRRARRPRLGGRLPAGGREGTRLCPLLGQRLDDGPGDVGARRGRPRRSSRRSTRIPSPRRSRTPSRARPR